MLTQCVSVRFLQRIYKVRSLEDGIRVASQKNQAISHLYLFKIMLETGGMGPSLQYAIKIIEIMTEKYFQAILIDLWDTQMNNLLSGSPEHAFIYYHCDHHCTTENQAFRTS